MLFSGLRAPQKMFLYNLRSTVLKPRLMRFKLSFCLFVGRILNEITGPLSYIQSIAIFQSCLTVSSINSSANNIEPPNNNLRVDWGGATTEAELLPSDSGILPSDINVLNPVTQPQHTSFTISSPDSLSFSYTIEPQNPPESTLNTMPDQFDFENIFRLLSSRMEDPVAFKVTQSLYRHYQSTMEPITYIRPTVIYPLTETKESWPLVEWVDGDDTDVVAIFKVVDNAVPCSHLMHCGLGRWQGNGSRWRETHLEWLVSSLDDVKELFHVGLHIFGMVQWPSVDLFTLYCKQGPQDASDIE